MMLRKFHVTTPKNPEGIIFGYSKEIGTLMLIEIKQENIDMEGIRGVFSNIVLNCSDFLNWCTLNPTLGVTELSNKITFQLFWDKYNDKERSSKKRAEKLWGKLNEDDQVRAYYFIDRYNKNRGSAEKKYAETYLNAEMWNN